eukprot:scaffold2108_cov66-Cylindrotheca_fusiformis.AAC.2
MAALPLETALATEENKERAVVPVVLASSEELVKLSSHQFYGYIATTRAVFIQVSATHARNCPKGDQDNPKKGECHDENRHY